MSDFINDVDPNKLYKIYSVVHEMMKDRGFFPMKKQLTKERYISKIIGYMAEEISPAEFLDKLMLMFCNSDADEGGDGDSEDEIEDSNDADEGDAEQSDGEETNNETKFLVYFSPFRAKFRKMDTQYIHSIMQRKKADGVILIINDKLTSRIMNILTVFGGNSQLFNEEELNINITKHKFVPKHEKMNNQDVQRFYDDYKVTPDKIPFIFKSDPVVKYYNYNVGDLLRIHRPRGEIYYRIVVNE